jgi:hypothetical protein
MSIQKEIIEKKALALQHLNKAEELMLEIVHPNMKADHKDADIMYAALVNLYKTKMNFE